MNRKSLYWKFFSAGEFFKLLFGIFLDFFHKRIPRRIFLAKNIIDYVCRNNGQVRTSEHELKIVLDGTQYCLRKKGSDLEVFDQIVMQRGMEKIVELSRKLNRKDIRIVDCGANIGLATIALKKNFPESEIISIEPEKNNFVQLTKNIQLNNFTNIRALEMGVWFEAGALSADNSFRDGENWSFALKTSGGNSDQKIRVNSLQQFAKEANWDRIDLLKVDIEGSEFELFRNLASWKPIFDTVKIVSIEVHEEVGSFFEIAGILWNNGFRLERHGELLIGTRD